METEVDSIWFTTNNFYLALDFYPFMIANRTCVITTNWEHGAGKKGTAAGPKRLEELISSSPALKKYIGENSSLAVNSDFVPAANSTLSTEIIPLKNGSSLVEHVTALCEAVENTLLEGFTPLVISADHSNAIGTVSGLSRTLGGECIGVIWVDAHLDLHSPYTTPSGNAHGMSVNALINDDNKECGVEERILSPETLENWEKLKACKANKPDNCVDPKHLVFIGTRSYEPQEWALIEKHGILAITPEEIEKNGIQWVIDQVNIHLKDCKYRYMSFDVDSLDPSISEATGTPEANGLALSDAQFLFANMWNHPQMVCVEITEYNPTLPRPEAMEEAVIALINAI